MSRFKLDQELAFVCNHIADEINARVSFAWKHDGDSLYGADVHKWIIQALTEYNDDHD